MYCTDCHTRIEKNQPAHYIYMKGYRCSNCADGYDWAAEPTPCGNCGWPIYLIAREKEKREHLKGAMEILLHPRHITCSEECWRACYNAELRKSRVKTDRPCETCGEPFLPKRADARYCSSRCRQKAYRDR